jgi:hypothetical protein
MIQKWYPLAFPCMQLLLEAKFKEQKEALNNQATRDGERPPTGKNTNLATGGGMEEDVNFFWMLHQRATTNWQFTLGVSIGCLLHRLQTA